jgi:uncharacterized Ntn-hydrolase superfamily protein
VTFSIVARDEATGYLGVATQTRYYAVGQTVPWARPGVGAVVTQALTEPAHGPRVLDLLESGMQAGEALEAVVAADSGADLRQIGIVDGTGRTAGCTGSRCIRFAGHAIGDGHVVAANLARAEGVPEAMSLAYGSASGPLARRMLAALEAGQDAGGDLRGRQSAALLVVSGDTTAPAWSSLTDIRVDDHDDPIAELARLLGLQEAYACLTRGLNHLFAGDRDGARSELRNAVSRAPGDSQIEFWWRAVEEPTDDDAAGTPAAPHWEELRRRLDEVGLFGE